MLTKLQLTQLPGLSTIMLLVISVFFLILYIAPIIFTNIWTIILDYFKEISASSLCFILTLHLWQIASIKKSL